MADAITPSTGRRRPVGDLRMNTRGFAPGDRILYRTMVGEWYVGTAISCSDTGIRTENSFMIYRDALGVLPDDFDATALLEQLNHATLVMGDQMQAARNVRDATVTAILGTVDLGKRRT